MCNDFHCEFQKKLHSLKLTPEPNAPRTTQIRPVVRYVQHMLEKDLQANGAFERQAIITISEGVQIGLPDKNNGKENIVCDWIFEKGEILIFLQNELVHWQRLNDS